MRKCSLLLKKSLVLLIILLLYSTANCQLQSYLLQMADSNYSYSEIKAGMAEYLDSLKSTMDSTSFYQGGSEYREFMFFEQQWAPRLAHHGSFSMYMDEEVSLSGLSDANYNYVSEESWRELGPNKGQTASGTAEGIGPMEFVTFFDNGTASSTQYMLAGSTLGGLFYSTDNGNSWDLSGSDKWDLPGCAWAIFHPTDHETWYACSGSGHSAGSSFITKLGGIYRTTDEGQNWSLIADWMDFGSAGSWTTVYKILLEPNDPKTLYAATSKGVFKTDDCEVADPVWTNIYSGFVFDMEFKPGSASTIYCAAYVNNSWNIAKTTDYGANWLEMSSRPKVLTGSLNTRNQFFTIEVSKANPNKLYCITRNGSAHEIHYYDFSSGPPWTNVATSFYYPNNPGHGSGHGFGVEQVSAGEDLMITYGLDLAKYNIYKFDGPVFDEEPVHVDVEDIIYHPYNSNEIWACTHGGVEKSIDGGLTWTAMYDGLGVAQIESFTDSYTNPEYILAGIYHDGQQLTQTDYSPDWQPDWKWPSEVYWDGMQPLIDNTDPNHMWGSGQRGVWYYSDDSFSTTPEYISGSYGTSYFITTGVLNKSNPEVFYRNKFDVSGKEEVYRGTNRGLTTGGTNEHISSFHSLFPSTHDVKIMRMITHFNDPDIMVLYLYDEDPSGSRTWHLFRSTNINDPASLVSWEELDIPLHYNVWLSSIEFDPDNPDIIYLAYGYSSNPNQAESLIYKLDYSNGTVPTVTDLTKNLPLVRTRQDCIAAEAGSDGGIFLATNFGVFYTNNDRLDNNSGDEWALFGKYLPNNSRTGIRLNYVSNTLRLACFGRGIWEASLPCVYYNDPLIISSNTTWNTHKRLDRDIEIQSGATLTLDALARVNMPEDAKIIVKPGAKLIVNGATVSNSCDGFWHGIEVQGVSSASQYPDASGNYSQGYLEIKNEATIENANNAVTLWKQYDWNSMGGIVKATEANFINNRRSVEFMSYQNFDPNTGQPAGNLSSFEECIFEVSDDYISLEEFAYHISMWEVDGVQIKGCSFINSNASQDKNGFAIYTMDAEFQVSPTNTISPVPSTFVGFYGAISALNSQSLHPIYVYGSYFDNNGYGVKLSKSDYATIIFNEFGIGSTQVSGCSNDYGVGVDLLNCNDYAIEENEFYPSPSITGKSIGVCVNYEEGYANEVAVKNNQIYMNTFDGLTVGNEALGNNRMAFTLGGGLMYLCNENDNNTYDFYIKDEGIPLQGRYDKAAGNTFTQDGNNPYGDFNNQTSSSIIYFYDDNSPDEEPLYHSTTVIPRIAQNGNDCLSNYRGDGNTQTKGLGLTAAEQNTYEQSFVENEVNYNGTLTLYENLKDGGNTEGVIIEIESSWPIEMLALRADLLEDSPYLSRRVLKATADNTDVFPDAVIFEILAANPDEMRDEEFLTYLAEKENPLPQYYIDILRGLAGEVSYKTILQCQLNEFKHSMAQAADIIVRNMLNDSICNMDAVRNWLGSIESFAAECQIIDSYLQEKDAANAQSRLNNLSTTIELTAEDSVEFNRYTDLKTLQINLINQGRNIFMLDSTEKVQLEAIALNSVGVAGTQAQNILSFVYGQQYNCCPEFPDSTHKSYEHGSILPENKPSSIILKVFPNPTSNWTAFEYQLPINDGNVFIRIYNAKGQLEKSIKLDGLQGQKIWDLQNVNPGVYSYMLELNGEIESGKLIIQ